jgi:hypothetical protein
MRHKRDYHDCLFFSDCLDSIATFWSNTYTLLVFLSIVLGILVLTEKLGSGMMNWIIGFLALIFTILLQIFKERMEKVHGYRSLSNEFKILNRNFSSGKNSSQLLGDLNKLTKKLAEYPISEKTKTKIRNRNKIKTD